MPFCGSVTLTTFLPDLPESSATELLLVCNDIHPNIQFTIEKSSGDVLPYLDLKVKMTEDSFSHTLYTKPSQSRVTIPCRSHHPRYILINVLYNEPLRTHNNESNAE